MQKILNLGILAHVDAGKTSLTERLLFTAGVIKHVGSVDAGNTQTDSLALERQRGITIKSAVASFDIGDTRVNLIDTPGHPDFIAEVERVLSVLDGVVLVISAVEGVQPQTRILMRALKRLKIPTIIFVNKIDRTGARYESLVKDIAEKLSIKVARMGKIEHIGQPKARFVPNNNVKEGDSTPIFFGSAMTGEGVDVLMHALPLLLPNAHSNTSKASGKIFKIERGQRGEKIAYIRMFSGAIKARARLPFGKITQLQVFSKGKITTASDLYAGEIGKLWGLDSAQVGDSIGDTPKGSFAFAAPTLEAAVVAKNIAEQPKLYAALKQLAEQDPLITLRQIDQKLYVSLYGEVQKEVIIATLADDFGVKATFERTQPICIERPAGVGYAVQLLQEESNPTSATIGLRLEPGEPGSGIVFRLDVHPRLVPLYIYKHTSNFKQHMTEYIRQSLKQGLYGLEVTDCIVTMTESGSYTGDGPAKPFSDTPKTTAADFRKLTPLVLRAALQQAGTVVCEPICKFTLEIPNDSLPKILPILAQMGAVTHFTNTNAKRCILKGDIRAAQIHDLQKQLPSATSGEGFLEYELDRYSGPNS